VGAKALRYYQLREFVIIFAEEPFNVGFLGGSRILRLGLRSKSLALFNCKCLFPRHFNNYLVIIDKTIYWAKGYNISDIVYWVGFELVPEKNIALLNLSSYPRSS
jgi:hypothetical protein